MPLSNAFHDDICQKQKLQALSFAGAAVIGIVLCSLARSVPAVDDWLSGPPQYVRPIANIIAEGMATKFKGLYPIIVVKADYYDCRSPGAASTGNSDPYFLINYSEDSRSVCVTRLEKTNQQSTRSEEISQATGRNYGRALQEPVRVVPVQHYPINFHNAFLSSLHWRAHPQRSDTSGISQTAQLPDAGALQEFLQGFSINLANLRGRVAERHNSVDRLLAFSLGLMIAVLLVAAYRVRILYESVQRYCATYDLDLRLTTYLRKNVTVIAHQARTDYYARHVELQAQVREEKILRHSEREAREDLLALFQTVRDDQQRALIQNCLEKGTLADMKCLLRRLGEQPTERTAAERLDRLLESLKEYCIDDEFEPYRKTAFEVLENRGFRDARTFVVQTHCELRKRARELEKHKRDSAIAGALLAGNGDSGSNGCSSRSSLGHSGKR